MRYRPAVLAVALGAVLFAACSKNGNDNPPPASADGDDGSSTPAASTPVNPGSLGVLEPNRPKVGEVAPDFALIDARDGSVKKLSDYRGKAVVLNWYASWCGPCKEEIPELQGAAVALPDELTVVGMDYRESREKALSILNDYSATYDALLDSDGDVAEHYRATGTPTTYFIDAQGVVRAITVGPVRSKVLQENLAKVNVDYVAK